MSIPVVSYGAVLEGDEHAVSSIKGRIAFVGSLLDESAQYFAVPRLQVLSDGRRAFQLPRVAALAATTETLLRGAPTRDANSALVLLWNLLWCLALLTVMFRRHVLLAALIMAVVLVLSLVATAALHVKVGLVLPGGLLLGCIFVCGLHALVLAHIESLKARLPG
jgi:CHASE2 domain-containing sensor protein